VIVYLDASALVKRYVAETGSEEVAALVDHASLVGTVVLSRVEVSAALARANRMSILPREEAWAAQTAFEGEWASLVRVQVTEVLAGRAATLAWDHGLRGYDSVHLAAALFWQAMVGDRVVMATYDRQLWEASRATSLDVWPERLP